MDYSLWQKKLGDVHISLLNRTSGTTICGRPMLGNNYAPQRGFVLLDDVPTDQVCKICAEYLEAKEDHEEKTLDFSEKSSHGMACDFDRIMKKAVTVRNRLPQKQSDLFLKQLSKKFGDLEELVNDWYDTTGE
jgi:hypothetical protein